MFFHGEKPQDGSSAQTLVKMENTAPVLQGTFARPRAQHRGLSRLPGLLARGARGGGGARAEHVAPRPTTEPALQVAVRERWREGRGDPLLLRLPSPAGGPVPRGPASHPVPGSRDGGCEGQSRGPAACVPSRSLPLGG